MYILFILLLLIYFGGGFVEGEKILGNWCKYFWIKVCKLFEYWVIIGIMNVYFVGRVSIDKCLEIRVNFVRRILSYK